MIIKLMEGGPPMKSLDELIAEDKQKHKLKQLQGKTKGIFKPRRN